MTRRFTLLACLALVSAAPASAGSWLQDGAEAPSGAAGRLGLRPGGHEVQLHAGFMRGELAYSNDKIAPPLNNEPVRLRIELDDGASFGLGYFYQPHERWMVGGTLSRMSSEFAWEVPFDRAAEEEVLLAATVFQPNQGSELTMEQKLALLDRVESRSVPRDVDLTLLDVSAVYLMHPQGPWSAEVGAGLGWAFADTNEDPMIWETLFRNSCDPTDPNCSITIANELVDPATAGRCPIDDDPCVELEAGSGLTWHLLGGLRYAFTDAVHLRLGVKVRLLESITDPGDSLVTTEGSLGLAFRFGGD